MKGTIDIILVTAHQCWDWRSCKLHSSWYHASGSDILQKQIHRHRYNTESQLGLDSSIFHSSFRHCAWAPSTYAKTVSLISCEIGTSARGKRNDIGQWIRSLKKINEFSEGFPIILRLKNLYSGGCKQAHHQLLLKVMYLP